MVGWFAIVAPTGTPAAVIERVNRDVNALLNDKDVAERIAAIGPIVDGSMSVEQVGAFLRSESARWAADHEGDRRAAGVTGSRRSRCGPCARRSRTRAESVTAPRVASWRMRMQSHRRTGASAR